MRDNTRLKERRERKEEKGKLRKVEGRYGLTGGWGRTKKKKKKEPTGEWRAEKRGVGRETCGSTVRAKVVAQGGGPFKAIGVYECTRCLLRFTSLNITRRRHATPSGRPCVVKSDRTGLIVRRNEKASRSGLGVTRGSDEDG